MHPINTSDNLTFPSSRVTELEDRSFIEGDWWHNLASRVFNDCDSGARHVSVHEEVAFVQVTLDEDFVLLGILACDDQVVLRGDEPVKLLKPKDFSHAVHLLSLSMLSYFL